MVEINTSTRHYYYRSTHATAAASASQGNGCDAMVEAALSCHPCGTPRVMRAEPRSPNGLSCLVSVPILVVCLLVRLVTTEDGEYTCNDTAVLLFHYYLLMKVLPMPRFAL